MILEDRVDQSVLGGEASVERSDPDAGAAGDLLDAGVDARARRTPAGQPRECAHGSASRIAAQRATTGPGKWRARSAYASVRRVIVPAPTPIASRPGLLLAVLALGGVAYAMLQSLVVPALPTLQHDLAHDADGRGLGLHGVSARGLGRRRRSPAGSATCSGRSARSSSCSPASARGTLLAALATSLPVMIGARTIQGLGGAIFPLAFGIIRDEFPRERVAGGIALISGLLGVGAGLGIILAGPILEHLDYHWLFWIPLRRDRARRRSRRSLIVPESPVRAPGNVNWLGAVLLSRLARLPPACDQRGADLGLALGRARSACSRRRPCSPSSGSGPRRARAARSST